MRLITDNGRIVAEAGDDYQGPMAWIEAPEGYVQGSFEMPGSTLQPTYPQLTSLEYLDLFTEAEQLAVVGATMTVPAVKLWYDRVLAASFVTYADPRTEAGLQALVESTLLTPERKAEIAAAMQAA